VPTPLIIGHRGASAVAPENTMAAFREAIAAGSDGIEFDVRLTRDGLPVVIHDNSLVRTAGVSDRVADLTWSELEGIDVGSRFAVTRKLAPGSFATETVPSLEQLFALFEANDLILYLEMKCDSPSERVLLAEACCRLINEYSLKPRVIIECFDLPALEVVKSIDSEIKTAALFQPALTTPWTVQWIINQATAVQASALALHYRLVRKSLVEQAKDIGLLVAVWTVDDPAWVYRAKSIGIDALITNNPAAMLAGR